MLEQRGTTRYPFPIRQRIAAIYEGQLPSLEEFRSVRCVDLSRGGMAFYQSAAPNFVELVVALPVAAGTTFMAARVRHVSAVDAQATRHYHVGCCFTGRVHWSEQTQQLIRPGDIETASLLLLGMDSSTG